MLNFFNYYGFLQRKRKLRCQRRTLTVVFCPKCECEWSVLVFNVFKGLRQTLLKKHKQKNKKGAEKGLRTHHTKVVWRT